MTGTLGGALEARGIPAGEGRLTSEAVGEVETEGKVLVIRRIHITYHLKLESGQREVAQRVHAFHADFCPVYRSIHRSIEITSELHFESE